MAELFDALLLYCMKNGREREPVIRFHPTFSSCTKCMLKAWAQARMQGSSSRKKVRQNSPSSSFLLRETWIFNGVVFQEACLKFYAYAWHEGIHRSAQWALFRFLPSYLVFYAQPTQRTKKWSFFFNRKYTNARYAYVIWILHTFLENMCPNRHKMIVHLFLDIYFSGMV